MNTSRTRRFLRALAIRAQRLKFQLAGLFRKRSAIKGMRPPTDRVSFFEPLTRGLSATLEIGPLHAPICCRPSANVKYLDAFTTEELKHQYRSDPNVDTKRIVDVDYVWRGECYNDLIKERFDSVVTSHNIEHVPCLVSFLNNLESILNPGGAVYLAIPDKRYCFDYYKSESSLEEAIIASYKKRTRPCVSSLLRQQLLVTHNEGLKHWLGDHGQPAYLAGKQTRETWKVQLETMVAEQTMGSNYVDTHVWIFTPMSFARLISGLEMLGFIKLQLDTVHETAFGSHEFYAALRKP
jgi:predicted SAM-dependent methyltransferase